MASVIKSDSEGELEKSAIFSSAEINQTSAESEVELLAPLDKKRAFFAWLILCYSVSVLRRCAYDSTHVCIDWANIWGRGHLCYCLHSECSKSHGPCSGINTGLCIKGDNLMCG
jgi:hypothetical protein